MGLKSGFPIYQSGIDYNVSLSFPGSKSIITEGKDTSLMIPNSDYLVKFINGDLGISDSMRKSTISENMNSPLSSSDEMVFRNFAKLNNIELDSDINKYKENDRLVLPKENIELDKGDDLMGLKGLEITTIKSIFETQKPYIEIAKLIIGNLAKLEDITARIMPLLGVPLKTKSKKPKSNKEAVGFNNGKILKDELSKLESVSKKGGGIKVGKDGKFEKEVGKDDNINYEIISTIYSTGEFDSSVIYDYQYVDLKPDSKIKENEFESDLGNNDPYQKYKPKTIILGIFDSKGNPLNPLSKIKALDNQGDKVDTLYNKAGWILDSPKWVFSENQYQWPVFGGAKIKKKNNGDIIYYKKGDKNLFTGEDAIPDTPIITGFDPIQEIEYNKFFKDIMDIKMLTISELEQSERDIISNDIVGRLDIKSHLENVYNWGQSKSSVYNRLNTPINFLKDNGLDYSDDPFPSNIKKSFKPFRIYSNEALKDEKLINLVKLRNKSISEAGWVWIDPEADYITKVIRVDPTTKINYLSNGKNIESEIKSFVKNTSTFKISDDRLFNIEVFRSVGDVDDDGNFIFTEFDKSENVNKYDLENWNYIDNDGLISEFGVVNNEPVINNKNTFKINIWGNIPSRKYNNGENTFIDINIGNNNLYIDEINKIGDKWNIINKVIDVSSFIQILSPDVIINSYRNWIQNPNYSININGIDTKVSNVFNNFSDITKSGKVRLSDRSLILIDNHVITKWYYMTPSDTIDDYNNGNLDSGLPSNGVAMVFDVDANTIGNNNQSPIVSTTSYNLKEFQIRIRDIDSSGNIIDPSKILNNHLKTDKPFSSGSYGYGSPDDPQNIDIIKRFMLTELDTESYYIVEGILLDSTEDEVNSNELKNIDKKENEYYKLPDAIGAIKVFLTLLGDIFGKLIPNINKLIDLFKNPADFLTGIISDQMKDGFSFLSKDSISTFSKGMNFKKDGDKKSVKETKDFFKSSSLSNYVYVRDDGNYNNILDGVSLIPFDIFGKSISFGMEIDFNKSNPLGLIKSSFNRLDVKNLQNFISPKSFDDTNSKNLISEIDKANDNKTRIEFDDGTSLFIDNNNVDEYINDNESKYNFKYVDDYTFTKMKEVDDLIETGNEDNIKKSINILDNLSKINPNDKDIINKKEEAKSKLDKIQMGEQPLVKMILGLVTLPMKIIGGIIEWIVEFFKKLSNPMKLPSMITEFLSFSWIKDFFSTTGILGMLGIKMDLSKINDWLSKSKSDSIKNEDFANLNDLLSVSFGVKLPTYTKEQYLAIKPNMPLNLVKSLLCFIEKIVNGIIDFIWSTLGIEAVLKPPHIKLCDKDDKDNKDLKDNNDNRNVDSDLNTDGFYYEVKLSNGEILEFLDKESLDKYIDSNNDIDYNFL